MQQGRTALFFCFFLITAITSLLFLGELFVFADDRITREYDSSAYLQENDTRLVVRYPDHREMTTEDRDKILSLKYVKEVDLCDYANDVQYYFQEGKGYRYTYGVREETEEETDQQENSGKEIRDVELLDMDQFVRSAGCLTEKDLTEGRLPGERNEVVLYSRDKTILDTEQECYFTADNIWEPGIMYHTKVKVVGLLKKKTDQIYFDYRLCQMLTGGIEKEYTLDYCWSQQYKQYQGTMRFYPVIGEGLKEREVRVSSNFVVPSNAFVNPSVDLRSAFSGDNGGISLLHVSNREERGMLTEESAMLAGGSEKTHTIAKNGIVIEVDGIEAAVQLDHFTDQGAAIIEMSEELFNQICQPDDTQASVYISSYGRTDAVIKKLMEKGYDAVSTYRVSSTNYIESKVYQRLEVIGISSLVLIALMILQILLVRSVLKIKIRDYEVLKFMGMRIRQMERITYLEMGSHCMMAMITAVIIVGGLYVGRLPFIVNMIPYVTLPGVLLYLGYNILLMVLTVLFFHRLLRRRITS